MVAKYDWDVNTALAIMRAESGCNPNAYNVNTNGSTDKGLFQINSCHFDKIGDDERYDPARNVQVAYQIYKGSTWTAWSAYNNGAYQEYLN